MKAQPIKLKAEVRRFRRHITVSVRTNIGGMQFEHLSRTLPHDTPRKDVMAFKKVLLELAEQAELDKV